MKIFYLTTEAVPFAKTGGLADVCGTLPSEVAALGHQCAVIMPAFRSVRQSSRPVETTDISFAIPMSDSKLIGCRILKSSLSSDLAEPVPVYFIDQPQYFDRPSLYGDASGDYPDNAERFAFFGRTAIATMRRLGADADIVHCNDWQTGLVPAMLRAEPLSAKTKTVFTIHNLAYQGHFQRDQFRWTGMPWHHFHHESFEYYGGLNYLKTGLVTSDAITTVSPTYANEIKTPLHGCGLDPILRGRSDVLTGIINGIDPEIWNPATDSKLKTNFDHTNWQSGKTDNKLALQAEVGLPQDAEVPLIGTVGRLADQKGWDLMLPVIRRHVEQGRPSQWVVLGSGDPAVEQALRELTAAAPEQVAAYVGFSDALAHRIEAASDLFVMPSRYEPCGLNQLYSLRYGAVSVVTATGGLADTIVDANPSSIADDIATGFHVDGYSVDGLDHAISRALRTRYHEKRNWKKIVERGMQQDWTWRKSAAQYARLYESLGSLTADTSASPAKLDSLRSKTDVEYWQ
ncbi:MAG: glycogen synthase GlgA [Planctomycetota bacterium]